MATKKTTKKGGRTAASKASGVTKGKSAARSGSSKSGTAKKAAAKKTAAKKTAAKKTARKSSAKKTTAKKVAARKTAAKKSGAKKTGAKKTAAKKTAARKTAKKAPAKKTTAKKPTSPAKRNSTAKKSTAKKSARKKPVSRTTKKTTAGKSAKSSPRTATKKSSKSRGAAKGTTKKTAAKRKSGGSRSGTGTARVKSPFSAKELAHFRNLILERRRSAMEDIESLRSGLADSREQAENDTAYSFHMADAGTDAMEREKLYLMVARQQKYVGYLDRALERIENNTYGICKVTGNAISRERLEAVPHTEISIEAKRQQKR